MPEHKITVQVDGQNFEEWTSCRVSTSMRTLGGSFEVSVVEPFPPSSPARRLTFFRGNPVKLYLDGQLLVTGYIDARTLSYDAGSHTLGFRGRDRTGDLVDCSYAGKKLQYKNATVTTIVAGLCEQHGIPVVARTNVGPPIRDFRVDPTQTIASQIAQVCGYRAVLPMSIGDGKVYLDRLSDRVAHDSLVLGKNILALSADQDSVDRFSHYIVRAQAQMEDNPKTQTDESQLTYTKAKALAQDSEVKRYRPLVIYLDGDGTSADCLKRARWEAWTRNGKSREFTYTVRGWTQSNGDLWLPNTLVDVNDPWAWLTERMVIMDVEFGLDEEGGSISTLTVGHPYVFVENSEKEPDVGKDERKTLGARDWLKGNPELERAIEDYAKLFQSGGFKTSAEADAWWKKRLAADNAGKKPTIWNNPAPKGRRLPGGRSKGVTSGRG